MTDIIDKIRANNSLVLREVALPAPRSLVNEIDWRDRLIGLWGPKGVGKTTLLLSKLNEMDPNQEALYVSLDHPIFASESLVELAEQFYKLGGSILLLDEVHKYDNWSAHLKAIYDSLPNLKVVFSGSSALHLHKGRGDLSRRASMYKVPILSFREFLGIETKQSLSKWDLEEILSGDHEALLTDEVLRLKPLKFFANYIAYGAYPFYQEGRARYYHKLTQAINHTLESDLVFVHGLDARNSAKLKGVLSMVATSVPFVPKISDIAQAIELSRPTVTQYLNYLEEGGIISLLPPSGRGYSKLAKPEKIFLDNTNLLVALGRSLADIGTKRETFAASQLREGGYRIEGHAECVFIADGQHLLEIGGPNKIKSARRVESLVHLICDEIETGSKNEIPLWMLGFLY